LLPFSGSEREQTDVGSICEPLIYFNVHRKTLLRRKPKFVRKLGVTTILVMGIAIMAWKQGFDQRTRVSSDKSRTVVQENAVKTQDIAVLNLRCASGLPGFDQAELEKQIATLDQWARRVKFETERHLYKYRANPAEFENSEGYFRMVMMAVVVYEDFGVRYNPRLIAAPGQAGYHFFADSKDVFLHGLLGTNRTGTCSSLPVLYVALGRRLGYPLKLVTTKSHLFLRWEGQGERFNLEATGKGMNRYEDNHYKQWPFPVSEEEIRNDGFLKSLTTDEEMALFQSIRGHCLMEAQRYAEAAASYAQAAQLAPNARGYRLLHENALRITQLARKDSR
jgi:hypothetical protein